MEQITKRFQGICAFQERCRLAPKQCKFLHLVTEVSLQKLLSAHMETVRQIITRSNREPNSEITLEVNRSQVQLKVPMLVQIQVVTI